MTPPTKKLIENIIQDILFSDKSSVKSRASDVVIKDQTIGFSLDITDLPYAEAESIRQKTIDIISTNINDLKKITIVMTSNQPMTKNAHAASNDPGHGHIPSAEEKSNAKPKIHIDNVKEVIMIAAGKGGVGKSTIAALLAHKLTKSGKKVGIVDLDIYGPSIPNIFRLEGKPKLDNNKMLPLANYNIEVNSIGFLAAPNAAISWRGPMTSKAVYQLLSLTQWSNLDYLIIDTPPGTGDIHLSILQNYLVNHVIMITTPQKISQIDVVRSINLYRKFNLPIAGIIENMSYYTDQYGKKIQLFAGNAGAEIAKQHNLNLLMQIPIDSAISESCDLGENLQQDSKIMNYIDCEFLL